MEKMKSKKYCVGIDIGSVSLNCIVINTDKEIVFESLYKRHFGKIDEEIQSLVEELFQKFDETQVQSISFTGSHGKKFAERLGVFYEFETISQVLGALHLIPHAKSLICMGGQDTALLQIHHDGDKWELESFNANGPCASGTGSFIDQQAERLATALYEKNKETSQNHIDRILNDFIRLGLNSQKPANVACRCTVFTKSDMIHLQNKGEKLEDIIYGLHVGNARNYVSTIVSNQKLEDPIVFVGGLSKNELQVKAFKAYYPDLIVPPHNTSTGALGVALKALELKREDTFDLGDLKKANLRGDIAVPKAPRLVLKKTKLPIAKFAVLILSVVSCAPSIGQYHLAPNFANRCPQTIAILPGVSRSGTTVAAALALGVAPVAAAEFSFLMSVIAISGAAVRSLPDLVTVSANQVAPLVVGGVAGRAHERARGAVGVKLVREDAERDHGAGFEMSDLREERADLRELACGLGDREAGGSSADANAGGAADHLRV